MSLFPKIFSLFKLNHISIDRAQLALQNCVYDIFLLSSLEWKFAQILCFLQYKTSFFFSISTRCIGHKSNINNIFSSVCSPFNSVSIHIFDLFSKRWRAGIINLWCWGLTPFLPLLPNSSAISYFLFSFLLLQLLNWLVH